MRIKVLFSVVAIISLFAACVNEPDEAILAGTVWQASDNRYTLIFTSDSTCEFTFPKDVTSTEIVGYRYNYSTPELVMIAKSSSAHANYTGIVSGSNIVLTNNETRRKDFILNKK